MPFQASRSWSHILRNKRALSTPGPKMVHFKSRVSKISYLRLSRADTKSQYWFELQDFLVGTIIALLMALDTYLRALWAAVRAPQSRFNSGLFQHSPLIHQACPSCLRGQNKGNMGSLEITPFILSSKMGLLGSPQLVLHWRIHNRALIPALIFRHFAQTFNCNQWNMEMKARGLII